MRNGLTNKEKRLDKEKLQSKELQYFWISTTEIAKAGAKVRRSSEISKRGRFVAFFVHS